MPKGLVYGPERAIMRDPRSGLRIIRLTHHSTISANLYFEMCSFSTDDEYVFLISQRYAGRDAPWDLFRARTDGLELVQATDCDDIGGIAVSPEAGAVFYQSGGELRRLDAVSLEEETVAQMPGVNPKPQASLGSIDAQGKTYFAGCTTAEGGSVLIRVDVASGKVDTLYEGGELSHVHVDPTGGTVSFGDHREDGAKTYVIDADGGNLREPAFTQFAHSTWFGETGKRQGCLLPPGHAIVIYGEGDREPEVVTEGRYYWHSSASHDAQWIVADTNWPREGIYLVHVPTRTVTFVCDPRASCSHPQWTHPHPSLSPGMKFVLFNSDMTGLGQVYLAELTPDFLEQAAKGYQCVASPAG